MELLLNPWFWAFVLVSHLASFLPLPVPRSAIFGILNLLALYILAGAASAVFLVILSTTLWGAFRAMRGAAAPATRAVPLAATLVVAALAVIFVAYKILMEHSAIELGPLRLGRERSPYFRALAGLGFSYVFLRAWDVAATLRNPRVPLLDPLSLAGFLAPFHMLAAGPIGAYQHHLTMNDAPPARPQADATLAALNGIATGLVYKFVIAEGLRIFAFGVNGTLASRSWLDTALLIIYVFFDFAGYSRVARAIGELNGVPTPINFSAPFASTSVTEFWTRWHMSLGAFVRRNIYLPLQVSLVRAYGLKWAYAATLVTLVVSFGFVGLWHRLAGHFILWGTGMGLLMAVEKLLRDRALARWKWTRTAAASYAVAIVGPVYVFVAIVTSLHFVMSDLLHA